MQRDAARICFFSFWLHLVFESSCAVFILSRGIAGIPHFHKKSPKLSDVVRDKSPTLNHVAVFKIVFTVNILESLCNLKFVNLFLDLCIIKA